MPIYQTNSPEECQYVLENSDSKVVIVEDDEQIEKIRAVRERLPLLKHVVRMTGESDDAISLDELASRGRRPRRRRVGAPLAARSTPADICTFIYTSGTTGPPKGCVITHGNYRAMLDMVNQTSVIEAEDVTYLYLPLAHSFALLVQLGSFDLGATIAYWERDPLKIVPNLAEVRPTYFPSVPRIFEKIYAARDRRHGEGGRAEEGDLRLVDPRRRPDARGRNAPAASPASCCASCTSSPTGKCSRRSAACSAASSASRSPARRRSAPTSCASSTPPECSCSRAGG